MKIVSLIILIFVVGIVPFLLAPTSDVHLYPGYRNLTRQIKDIDRRAADNQTPYEKVKKSELSVSYSDAVTTKELVDLYAQKAKNNMVIIWIFGAILVFQSIIIIRSASNRAKVTVKPNKNSEPDGSR